MNITPINGSPFALRHDGAGSDPVDHSYSDGWCTVLRLVGEGEYQPLRRFASEGDALGYIQVQLKAARQRADQCEE